MKVRDTEPNDASHIASRTHTSAVPAKTDTAQFTARASLNSPSETSGEMIRRLGASRTGRPLVADHLLGLQRTIGNRLAQTKLAIACSGGENEAQVNPSVEQDIQQARVSGGQALDGKVRTQMESAMGADFGDVRVHTGAKANALNHSLNARAFATGQDIFFRNGEYRPGSSAGRELLAHELTHVVQQGGAARGLQRAMTLGRPGDQYEQEADAVARAVIQQENMPSGPSAQRQPEEEEEQVHAKHDDNRLRRQEEEDEPS